MKKLNRKVFLTIYLLITVFLLFGIIVYNVSIYKKEHDAITRNLSFIDRFNVDKDAPKNFGNPNYPRENREVENMMIMDYEVYTVKIKNNSIDKIIDHGNANDEFDVENIVDKILQSQEKMRIGNLYNNKYSYNYKLDDTIIIINTTNINTRLTLLLIKSLVLFLLVEIILYFVTKILTKWITHPAMEALKKQKEFIADASHELKTPLAVIIASSDELKSDKKNEKYIDNIKYESDRMNKLITSLLDLSKIESRAGADYKKEENLSKIVEKICLTFESIAYENGVTIKLDIDSDVSFKCSKDEIEKLVSIILDNAVKHSNKDSEITVCLKKDKSVIFLEITNIGDEITKGDEEKIFERFYRGDKSRDRSANRYGLGLAIAKNIVINHNGTIKAYSSGGKTTFKIIFKK